MIRKLIIGLSVLALLAGCGGSDEKEDTPETAAVGTPVDDAPVESAPITFDPLGSDSGNIPGLSTINFEYDKAALTTEARRLLAENADWIRNNGAVNVQIEGHCDERGSIEYNLSLGERRANAVRDYLISLGVDPNRLNVLSYGEEKPAMNGEGENVWARNRRANFVPLPQ